jgi:hypothetical protein
MAQTLSGSSLNELVIRDVRDSTRTNLKTAYEPHVVEEKMRKFESVSVSLALAQSR